MASIRIPPEEYARRRARLMAAMGDHAIALIAAAPERVRNHDVHYPFRQDSDFRYLTGFPEPEALALSARLRDLPSSDPGRTALLVRRRDVESREDAFSLPQIATLEAEVQARRQLIDVMREQRDEALVALARLLEDAAMPSSLQAQQVEIGDLRAKLEAAAMALARLLGRRDARAAGHGQVGPRGIR